MTSERGTLELNREGRSPGSATFSMEFEMVVAVPARGEAGRTNAGVSTTGGPVTPTRSTRAAAEGAKSPRVAATRPVPHEWGVASEGPPPQTSEGETMGIKDKVANAAAEVAGKAKKTIGRVADDPDLEARGAAEETVAKGKRIVEQVKDSAEQTATKIRKIAT